MILRVYMLGLFSKQEVKAKASRKSSFDSGFLKLEQLGTNQ